jgi:hypothetical protein
MNNLEKKVIRTVIPCELMHSTFLSQFFSQLPEGTELVDGFFKLNNNHGYDVKLRHNSFPVEEPVQIGSLKPIPSDPKVFTLQSFNNDVLVLDMKIKLK